MIETRKRISRDNLYLSIATLIAQRGTCDRAQVGAVITRSNRIVATGYNGPLPYEQDCGPGICDLTKGCSRAVHAEANAISFAARNGVALEDTILYCTFSPCIKCCELIIQSGIKRVVYSTEYRITDGIDLLKKSNIEVCQVSIE